MGRRTTIFEDVAKMPWPVGVVLAGLVFVGLQVIQASESSSHMIEAIKPAVKIPAYVFIGIFLFCSLISLMGQMRRRRRFVATNKIADIRSLSWEQFESWVGDFFRDQGYSVVETPAGPDGGVDLVLRKDGETTFVQCKQWKNNQVGVEQVRLLLGSMAAGGAQGGIFVTTGTYTAAARKLAQEVGIQLIDGEVLAAAFDSPQPIMNCPTLLLEREAMKPECPECGAVMVERVAKRGAKKGQSFWGCPSYPKCTGTRDILVNS